MERSAGTLLRQLAKLLAFGGCAQLLGRFQVLSRTSRLHQDSTREDRLTEMTVFSSLQVRPSLAELLLEHNGEIRHEHKTFQKGNTQEIHIDFHKEHTQ